MANLLLLNVINNNIFYGVFALIFLCQINKDKILKSGCQGKLFRSFGFAMELLFIFYFFSKIKNTSFYF